MNIQHSSRSDQWQTPPEIISLVHKVLRQIDFDPASCDQANKIIQAKQFYSQRSLETPWPEGSIYCNPPGSKIGNKSQTGLFWQKLMEHRNSGKLTHAIFMAFSAEALQTTQNKGWPSIGSFTFCIPAKRIKFIHPDEPKNAPSHSNVIVYVPGTINHYGRFMEVFYSLGQVCIGI